MKQLGEKNILITDIEQWLENPDKISISPSAKQKIEKCYQYLQKQVTNERKLVYGVNTGFGSLCNTKINNDDLEQLQTNLLTSHACGMGNRVPDEIVRIMLLLKIQSLSLGHSGVQIQTVEMLLLFFKNDILPIVYEQGSLGASGDLAPLAHLCLPLLGLGEVMCGGKQMSAEEALKIFNITPIKLKAKEGLALINGTQFMASYGVFCLLASKKMWQQSNIIAAMSIEAFDGRIDAFIQHSHIIRPHKGQILAAQTIFELLKDSKLLKQPKSHVQDPYSFRCVPQVHGATWDVLSHAEDVFTTEINSVTDNPNVFPDEDVIISAGNFHGQTLALQLDFMAIAMSEIANISERRIYKLIAGERNLPAFLTPNPGLNSGFMIPQYTAASIVSQNKQYCTPASIDSIMSSNGQEDHVSMGANAATKCLKVINNVKSVLAIELLTAAQALDFRNIDLASLAVKEMHNAIRNNIPFIQKDEVMYKWMQKAEDLLP